MMARLVLFDAHDVHIAINLRDEKAEKSMGVQMFTQDGDDCVSLISV